MKVLLSLCCVTMLFSVAWAERPSRDQSVSTDRRECDFGVIIYDWDFSVSDCGFTTGPCDEDGLATWAYGLDTDWGMNVWATGLNASYPNNAGESLISPSFVVDASTYLVEIFHAYSIEQDYDGGNLAVNGVVVPPLNGYPLDVISPGTGYYAWCVDGEPGFNGLLDPASVNCFDLSEFMGQEVQLSFDFGSDSYAGFPGWNIGYVRVGGDVVSTQAKTWSQLKGLYR